MNSIAPDQDTLRELDDDTRQAWSSYNDRLRQLTGEEYERVESESWTALQEVLERVERRREKLTTPTA